MRMSHDRLGFTSDWLTKLREFLSQSCSVVDAKPITFPHSSENCSIYRLLVVLFVCFKIVL